MVAQNTTALIAPYLPYLLKLGDKAAEEAAKKLGGNAWEHAKALWNRLSPKAQTDPALKEAVTDLALTPEDEDARAVLRVQIKKLLSKDNDLAREVADVLCGDAATEVNLSVSGDRSVGVGGSITGGIIITGNRNKIQ